MSEMASGFPGHQIDHKYEFRHLLDFPQLEWYDVHAVNARRGACVRKLRSRDIAMAANRLLLFSQPNR
jgi:hypothetical protein